MGLITSQKFYCPTNKIFVMGNPNQNNTPWRNENKMRQLYLHDEMSLREIANEFGCVHRTVSRWMDRFGIERRERGEAQSKKSLPKITRKKLNDPEWLEEKYWGEELTMEEVSDIVDVSYTTVWRRLEKHGIEKRVIAGSNHHGWLGDELEYECEVCGSVERRQSRHVRGVFCSYECEGEWISENLSGKDSPTWKGGYSPHENKLWKEQRQKALERDGYVCQRCGLDRAEHREKYGQDLNVHHIKPAREFDVHEKMHDLDNLIVLCAVCHNKLEGLPIDRQ